MPSFRAQLGITGLRPGFAPERVMEAAVDAVGAAQLVEANQLEIVGGVPRIAVRFTVEPTTAEREDRQALQAAANMLDAVAEVARTGRPVSQGHMLEMMLAVWRDARGRAGPGGGLALVLPETTMRAAEDLARHLGVPVEQAVGDAIAARMIGAGLAKPKPAATLRG